MRSPATKKTIARLLKNYFFSSLKITPLPTSGNLAFRIQDGKHAYFLKLSPAGQRKRAKKEILAELEVVERLIEHGLPVPAPIPDPHDNVVLSLRGHCGYLRKFVNANYKTNPTVKNVYEFGKVMGKMHAALKNFRTKNPRLHVWDPVTTRRHYKQDRKVLLSSGLDKNFIDDLGCKLGSFSFPNSLPSGMIHEDLGKRHVLWRGSKIAGIIDFDRVYYGKLILDLGQAIRGWCFVNDWSAWSQVKFDALLKGYTSERKLTGLEKKYLIHAIRFAVDERCLAFSLHAAYKENPRHARLAIQDFYKLNRLLDNLKIK